MLSAWLTKRGCTLAQISVALHKLRTEADNHNRTLYGNNQAVYNLLRYGVPVKTEAGKVAETVHLIDWQDRAERQSVLGPSVRRGYTRGMKTAVSIPDDIFEKVERLARRGGRSRSEVFSAALREYVARHAPDEVTEAMDRVCSELGDQTDASVSAAGLRVLERTEW